MGCVQTHVYPQGKQTTSSQTRVILVLSHIAPYSTKHITFFPCSNVTQQEYDSSTEISRSISSPLNFMWIYSLISACMKAAGMSQVPTLQLSIASIRQLRVRDSMLTVSKLVLALVLETICYCASAQPLPLILPLRFSFKNMRYFSDLDFSCGVGHLEGSLIFQNGIRALTAKML
jgi:hypothetical protein